MRLILVPALATGGLLLAGCSGAKDTVTVTATDTSCTVGKASLQSGKHTFRVKNEGSKVTEVYVYAAGDKKVDEVEDIGPGTSRDMTVGLDAGSYSVVCKPGQTGDGIRQSITVTG